MKSYLNELRNNMMIDTFYSLQIYCIEIAKKFVQSIFSCVWIS